MKFNALVVAAMVVTSVNAGLVKELMGCFRGSCESDEFQDSEGVEDDRGNGSKVYDIDAKLTCDTIVSILDNLYNQMLELSDGVPSLQSISSSPNGKTNNLKAGDTDYFVSQDEATSKLEAIKKDYVDVKAQYDGLQVEFIQKECSTKGYTLISQEKMLKMDKLFN
ncbi:hypothetical protein BASA81_016314 [Batrachochytrium salamandrivorans]|nr:hypothetical protein BASA81_016314 [Batrachochytrium salamandrivorans]